VEKSPSGDFTSHLLGDEAELLLEDTSMPTAPLPSAEGSNGQKCTLKTGQSGAPADSTASQKRIPALVTLLIKTYAEWQAERQVRAAAGEEE
jgi:hypothetical protein